MLGSIVLPRSTPGAVAIFAIAFAGALAGEHGIRRAAAAVDTTYCWPTVIVRDARDGRPLAASMAVFRLVDDGASRPILVESEPGGRVGDDGEAEIAALRPGRYLVGVRGSMDERPLRHWKPPKEPRTSEAIVGIDPWTRPTQVREFEHWTEWLVEHGNCADSLVVRVSPGRWVTRIPGAHWLTRFAPPPPYHVLTRDEERARDGRR